MRFAWNLRHNLPTKDCTFLSFTGDEKFCSLQVVSSVFAWGSRIPQFVQLTPSHVIPIVSLQKLHKHIKINVKEPSPNFSMQRRPSRLARGNGNTPQLIQDQSRVTHTSADVCPTEAQNLVGWVFFFVGGGGRRPNVKFKFSRRTK